jgi:hypothetical protein
VSQLIIVVTNNLGFVSSLSSDALTTLLFLVLIGIGSNIGTGLGRTSFTALGTLGTFLLPL